MGGFLRKVAGAFVYLDESRDKPETSPETGRRDAAVLEAAEAAQLLVQLGGADREGTPSPPSTAAGAADAASAASTAGSGTSASDMTADQVFAAAGVPDGPNSAQRILKIIAGLSMFPKDQQVAMVRAMDAADDTWCESSVLEDARARQSALRNHLQAIEAERARRLESIAARTEEAQAEGKRKLDEIDLQIAALQKSRQETVAATTSAMTDLEHEKKQVEEASEKARHGIIAVVNALSELITFFTGGGTQSAAKQ